MTTPLFIPVDLREDFIGGLLRISKKHFEWKLQLDKTLYSIELECSYLTNKRRVYLQKQLVSKGIKAVGHTFQYTFPLNSHTVTVRNSGTEADLTVDNVSFRGLYYAGVSAYTGSEAHEIQIPAEGPQRDPYLSKLWGMTPEQRKAEHENRVAKLQQSFGVEAKPDLLNLDTIESITQQTKQTDFLDFEPQKQVDATELPGPVKPSLEALYALDPQPGASIAKPARKIEEDRNPHEDNLIDFSAPQPRKQDLLLDDGPQQPPALLLEAPTHDSGLLDLSAKPQSDFGLLDFGSPQQSPAPVIFAVPQGKTAPHKAKEEEEFDKLFS